MTEKQSITERATVLVVDNDQDMRDMLAFRLDVAGYRVLTAASASAARELVEREIVHLAVVDVRLTDDSRPTDQTGFDFASELPEYIPHIAFTAYEDLTNLRLANKIGSRVLSKRVDDAIPQLLDQIRDTLARQTRVKLDLRIDPRGPHSLDDLAAQIQLAGPPGAARPCGADLARILQTLFYEAAAVEIEPLLDPEKAPTFSQSGSLLMLARPRYAELGRAEPVVVKFSAAAEIGLETANFAQIEQFLHGRRRPNLRGAAYSRRLGGLIYHLIDDEHQDTIRVFDHVYQFYPPERIVALLERFFGGTLSPLYDNARYEQLDLSEIYTRGLRLTDEKLEAALRRLHPGDAGEPQIRLPYLREPQLNPLVWLRRAGGWRQFSALVPVCLCHGDLHGRNILVDSNDNFWLIDFARVGQSHALRDFVELETDIKFHLLREIDLKELLPFERRLLAPARFGEALPAGEHTSQQLAKAYQVIGALRRIAAEQLKLSSDMREYYQALLFHTLNVLRLQHISDDQKEYALLAASLICQRLGGWPDWATPAEAPDAPPEELDKAAGPGAAPTTMDRVMAAGAFMLIGAVVAGGLLFVVSALNASWQQQLAGMALFAVVLVAALGVVGLVSGAAVVETIRDLIGRLLTWPRPPS